MRFLTFTAAIVVVGGLSVVALMTTKYNTTRACEAATLAIKQETPGILAELAKKDGAFSLADKATRPFRNLRESFEAGFSEIAAENAAKELADKSALECAGLILYRELDPQGFRKMAADQLLEKSAEAFGAPPAQARPFGALPPPPESAPTSPPFGGPPPPPPPFQPR